MPDLSRLKTEAKNFTILYAEDNASLLEQAGALLKKFFPTVYLAHDGAEALELFKAHHPKIVLSDIKMPNIDGMELSRAIKQIRPETKIVIMSAFDDKSILLESIKIGIFRFLKKPVAITELSDILLDVIDTIHNEDNVKIFYAHLKNIFNYQNAMTLLYKDDKPILANQPFLDFFKAETLKAFESKNDDIGKHFKPHSGFLFNDENGTWFEKVKKESLHHVKMVDGNGEMHHFILKFHTIPDKEEYAILSLDDVTDLKLLALFDNKNTQKDNEVKNQKALLDLLGVVQHNSAKVKLHNFYRGLTITNDAIITEMTENSIVLKTNYLEQKVLQLEGHTVISSEIFPHDIQCEKVEKINFESQTSVLSSFHFITRSPTERKVVRVEPEDTHKVTLFYHEQKFYGDVVIIDVSIDAVKLSLNALPAGMVKGSDVVLDMVFEIDKRPTIINTKASLFRSHESKYVYELVFKYELAENMKKALVQYISKRQMALIREFKGLEYGK